jgi:hypothetical protein
MIILLLLLAALIVLGVVLAVAVVKWLFILAVVAALCCRSSSSSCGARPDVKIGKPGLPRLPYRTTQMLYAGVCGSWSPMCEAGTCSVC